ncbi:dynamin family protein [Sphaerotilus hippei]|uniref:Dynamin family protein n=1 Tax=Sphaerotilus hippei TaxID=744406 RepID=A0A318GWY2_9BURK|nr:dynamin family protein [Sphaerotilus hippei]PXW94139.1 dynamin family protein [Sphaerotilus hippei]
MTQLPIDSAPNDVTTHEPFVRSLDAMGTWRGRLEESVRELVRFLREQGLLDEAAGDLLDSLRQRLAGEKLVVAFVAEFSRGKSELINAIFFADAGRRIMPATPGRTTMCPVELGWDADEPPGLSLLPIETRLDGASLAELRGQPRAWVRESLDVKDPESFAGALTAVMRTRHVPVDEARALGFWNDEQPADNPPIDIEGRVEVPMWRHAIINVPHPLLKRGLVVIDTPGLNAIGAEPELTVGLLPSAHVVVFVLGADTGVTRSDLEIWRDHLASQALTRYVVLNKIDALYDPLSSVEHSESQITRQCVQVARTLDVPLARVFPLSARQALEARVEGNSALLVDSRLLALEQALAQQLLPQRRAVFEQLTLEALGVVQQQTQRSLNDLRRGLTEQLMELRGLRGKNASKVQMLLSRVAAETTEFEQCTAQLQALRSVHTRMLKELLQGLSGDVLRDQVDLMIRSIRESLLKLGAKRSFTQLFAQLRVSLDEAQRRGQDIRDMLAASFTRLNTEFGFSLSPSSTPELSRFRDDMALIERNYIQYLGLSQAMRLAQPRFLDQFRRMLMSRLRVVFESAAGEMELWNRTASAQVDAQLRERRKAFKRRRESLERIRQASGELEVRVNELEQQELRLTALDGHLAQLFEASRRAATQREFGDTQPLPMAVAGASPVTLTDRIELAPGPGLPFLSTSSPATLSPPAAERA